MADIIKALREATNSAGGYLVPQEFAARVYELMQAKAVTLADLETVNMNHEVMYIPKVTSGTTAYWVPETNTITESEMAFGRITLTAKKVAALVKASTEVLEDANVSVANIIVDQMARDLALAVDGEVLNGTGGTFEGLRYTGSYVNSYSAGDGTGSANINVNAISKAADEVLTDNHQFPDVSYFHTRTVGSLRILTDGAARPLFNNETFGSPLLGRGVIGNVWGIPVKAANQLPINLSVGTGSLSNSATEAIVGVSKMFGIFGNRRALRFKKDYAITTDEDIHQCTYRCAFSVKYPEAYCVIKGIRN
jgi:HK97 family phage major capsid protein